MFGGDDDDDFSPKPSSKLASLFGLGKSSVEGNSSLTYTAPKQPKKNRGDSQSSKGQEAEVLPATGQTTSSPAKLSIIAVRAVHSFKLTDGNYNPQGKLGAAVIGNPNTRVYQLLLYKGKQQHVTHSRITPQFQFVVQENNYATFYDDQTENWSIMFESHEDAIDFTKEVGLARWNSAAVGTEQQLLSQDLVFGLGSGGSEGDSMEIHYTVQSLSNSKQVDAVPPEKPVRVKLKKGSWEEGLLGAAKGTKRMIILPPSLAGPWKAQVPVDDPVLMIVDVGRIKYSSRMDSGDSTDDTSIRARGASLSDALSNSPKTHKASIISRMARMGQATLPLKGAIACNPSDSEETEDEPSVVNKAPSKARVTKSRPAAEKPIQNVMMPPQQVAVFQPLTVPWQQTTQPQQSPQPQFVRNGSMAYMQSPYPLQTVSTPQMFPVSTPPAVPSPDSHLSVFLSESRTQNSEVRMGVAKVADKVDQVLVKLDAMQQLQHRRDSATSVMEPSVLMASIQKVVSENESLRSEVEEKRNKIDQLYTLLHSSVMESRNDSVLLALQQEKAKLSADLNDALSKTSSLEKQVASQDEELVSRQQTVKELEQKIAMLQQELTSCQQQSVELQKVLTNTEQQLSTLQQDYQNSEEKLIALQTSEQGVNQLTKSLEEELKKKTKEAATHMDHVLVLEEETVALKNKIHELQTEGAKTSVSSNVVGEVKKVMNVVYHQTAGQFSPDSSYSGAKVKQMLMTTIRDVTLRYLEVKALHEEKSAPQKGEEVTAKKEDTESSVVPIANDSQRKDNVKEEKTAHNEKDEREKATSQDLSGVEKPNASCEEDGEKPTLECSEKDKTKITNGDKDSQKANSSVPNMPDSLHSEANEPEKSISSLKAERSMNPPEAKVEVDKTAAVDVPKLSEKTDSSSESVKVREVEKPSLSVPEAANSVESNAKQTSSSNVEVEKASTEKKEDDSLSDVSHSSKEKQSRDSSLERSWRPQPPPVPLFDDDDDDDDWLS